MKLYYISNKESTYKLTRLVKLLKAPSGTVCRSLEKILLQNCKWQSRSLVTWMKKVWRFRLKQYDSFTTDVFLTQKAAECWEFAFMSMSAVSHHARTNTFPNLRAYNADPFCITGSRTPQAWNFRSTVHRWRSQLDCYHYLNKRFQIHVSWQQKGWR